MQLESESERQESEGGAWETMPEPSGVLSRVPLAYESQDPMSPHIAQASAGTGLEWMVIAAILVPAVLLLLIIWLGSRNTV